MSTAAAVVLSLGSAASFGLASALQHEQAGEEAVRGAVDPGLLLALARRPLWLVGIAADVVGVILQATALALGAVALVQPLLVAGLPLAVVLSALLAHRRLLRREVTGLLMCTVGLALLAPATATGPSLVEPTRRAAVVAGVVTIAATAALLVLARRSVRFAPAATGLAAGAVVGGASVLLAVSAGRVDDLGALFGSVAPYAAVAAALLGLMLTQASFQTGTLGAPLAALSVMEPVVAVVLAVLVLHERLPRSGGAAAAAISGALLAVAGVVTLCRESSPAESETAAVPDSTAVAGPEPV